MQKVTAATNQQKKKQIKTAYFAKSAIYPPVSKFCVNVTYAIIES